MQKENMSTADHAETITESVINGQKKQAVNQFRNALLEHCNASSLLADIGERIGAGRALIDIAAAYIETIKN